MSLLLAVAPVPAGALTLEQALDLAAKHRPALDAARARADAAGADLKAARAGRRPTVTLTAGATRMDDPAQGLFAKLSQGGLVAADLTPPEALNAPGPLNDLSAGVRLEQPLYTGGRVSAGIRRGRAGLDAARARLAGARDGTVAEVTTAYWDYVLAREALGVAERARDTARAHLKLAADRVAAGAGLEVDRLAAEAHLARTRRAVAERTRAVAVARVALESDLGVGALPSEPVEALPAQVPPAAPQNALIQRAQATSPAVATAEAGMRQAKAGLDGARGAYLPELGLMASAADHREALSGAAGQVWQVGAQATWALTDGGLRSARVAAARADLKAAEAEGRRVRQQVRGDVIAAYTLRETAAEQLSAARTELSASNAALGMVRDRYAAGAALFTELKEAEDQLAQADLAEREARHDLAVADAALRRAVGGPIGEGTP